MKTAIKTLLIKGASGILVALWALTNPFSAKAQIAFDYNLPAAELSEAIAGGGVQIINPELTCPDSASGGYSITGIPEFTEGPGIILSTGNIKNLRGPNNTEAESTIFDAPGNPIITAITGSPSFDACLLEFDIVPVGDTLRFNFTFASEEYDEYVGTPFNDFFGFFISGPGIIGDPGLGGLENIALVPTTSEPVDINSVNNGNPDLGTPATNPEFFVSNPLGFGTPIQYDGWTQGLFAERQVTPCDTFKIRLVVADVSDPEWDSAVLVEAIQSNSIALSQTNEGGLESTIEGCNDGTVTFTRSPVTDEEAIVTFFVDGTAINGTDYAQIGSDPDPLVPKSIAIPANEASAVIDITPFADGIVEGEEYIDIFVGNPNCVGTVQDSIRVFINDSIPVLIDPPLSFVCLGESLTFSVGTDDNLGYSWSPAVFLDDASIKEPTTTPLVDTEYTLTVSAGTCQSTALVEVRVSDVQVSATQENIDCSGDDNGSIDLTFSGGESPYEIQWSGPNGFTSTDEDISGLAPGIYAVLVTDRDGCTGDLALEILEAPEIEVEFSSPVFQGGNNVSCFAATDGQATALPSGGTPTYTYLWDDPNAQTTQTAVGLAAGTYQVTVTDANDCVQTGSITLSGPESVTGILDNRVDVLCNGENTGEITIIPTGGVAPYTVVWNTLPQQFGVTAVNLTAGFYTAAITDINGCQGTIEVEITEPAAPLSGNVAVTHQSCGDIGDGTATAAISGGTTPYTYVWSPQPGVNESEISDLEEGSYSLTVTDDNECTLTIPFVILSPAPIMIELAASTDPTCSGFNDGSLFVNATGGTAPYSYSWDTDPIQTDPSISNLEPGSYTVTVTDDTGCTAGATYELTEPSELELGLIELVPPSCNDFSDGSIEVEATGGTAPYLYVWNTVPPSGDPLLENLADGSYTVTVTDDQGCEATETYDLQQPEPLEVTVISLQDVLCSGEATGSVTIAVSGGTPDYAITWDDPDGQTGTTADNLIAGTYTATIVDENGCTLTFELEINEPENPLDAEITGQVDVLCFGDETGAAIVTATGGSGSYSYQWNDPEGQQTAVATGLAAGTYTVTVTDNNGCETPVTATVTIGGPDEALSLDLDPSIFGGGFNVACAEDSTATIDLTISGGTATYDVLWNLPGLNTSTDEDLSDLAPGDYSVVVTDANGCDTEASITLTAPTEISIEAFSMASLCFGLPQGAIDITISGGVPDYTADWTGPSGFTASGTDLDDLVGGVYEVTIEDANGCILLDAVTVIQPEDLVITVDSLSDNNGFNLSCFDAQDGEIYTTPSGGTPPYDYQWNTSGNPNFSNQEDVINLSPGIYEAVLIDDNGCVQNELIELTAPDTLELDFDLSEYQNGFNISCFEANDGSAEAFPQNGNAPFTYVWVGPNGFGPVFGNPVEDLEAGEYSVFATDATGCSVIETITLVQPEEFEIELIAETINGNNISCAGESDGSINLIIDGGFEPITVSWTGPNGFTSSNEDIFGLEAGEYCVTVTDDNNCSQEECITLTEPDPLSIVLAPFEYGNGFNLTCQGAEDGSIEVTAGGGTPPLAFQWFGPNGFTSTDEDISLLAEGEYCLTVEDANGCTLTECVELTAPEVVQLELNELVGLDCSSENDGSIDITIASGSAPFDIVWTGPDGFSSTDEDLTGLSAGTYCVEVTDANGCQGTDCYTISEPQEITAVFATSSFEGGFEIDCAGNDNGSISVALSGGTEPYELEWTGPDGFTSASAQISDLPPETYCLVVEDDNGCEFNECIDIEEPEELEIDPSITLPDCGDGTLATVDLQIAGGVTPYSVFWSNELDTELVSLDEGVYGVIVTDANACQAEQTIEIELPSSFDLDFDVPILPGGVNIACNGDLSGNIDLTPLNGNGVLTFDWTGPNGFTFSGEDPTGLEAGEYCVTATDEQGCEAVGCITLTEPEPITAGFDDTPVSCPDGSDGQLTVIASGGVPVYDIDWTGPDGFTASGETISGLTAGTYCADVIDANDCSETFCVDISEPEQILIDLSSPETGGFNIACFGDNSGSIESIVTGGTTEYNYSWTGPNGYASSNENLNNLFAGEYCLTITDTNGCQTTECITLTEAAGIDFVFNVFEYPNGFNTTCGNSCDGSIDLEITGGTAPIEISWTGPPGYTADTEDIQDLCPGTYTATTTDANGCEQSASVTLLAPEPLAITLESPVFGGGFEISCLGESNGTILTTLSGGIGDVDFSWNGPGGFTSDEENLTDLSAGTYDLTVTDGNGCSAGASITLTEPEEVLSVSTTVSEFPSGDNISCTGLANGSISTDVSGGTEPYGYNWNGPDGFTSEEENLQDLGPGDYTLVVLDANSCAQTLNFSLTEPADTLTAELEVVSEILCADSASGALSVTFTGGSPDIQILWIGPNDFTSNEFEITNLPSGTYTYAVTDANGCAISGAENLENPLPISISADITDPICESANGIIDVTVSGGTPTYEYLWNTDETSQDLQDLSAGVYSVEVTDLNGCQESTTFELFPSNNLEIAADITEPACFGDTNGAIEILVVSGNEPVDYDWTGPDGFTSGDAFIMNLGGGDYTLQATDANGCTVTETYTVEDPEPLEIDEFDAVFYSNGFNLSGFETSDGQINEPEVTGGTSPYLVSYSGPNGYSASGFGDQGGLESGLYTVTVTDANQCTAIDSVFLTQPIPIELPNGMSPNGDGFNDALEVRGLDDFPSNKLVVFNRWGNVVYEEINYNNDSPWFGTNEDGEELPEGTYFVVVELNGRDNLRGYLELRR